MTVNLPLPNAICARIYFKTRYSYNGSPRQYSFEGEGLLPPSPKPVLFLLQNTLFKGLTNF